MRPPGRPQPASYNIELVTKVIRVLEALRDAPGGLTLQALAAQTGMVKSSIHRTLGSLKVHGYVEQPASGGPYRLGIKCLQLASALRNHVELLPHARRHLQEIVDALDESAYLAVLRAGRGVFVDVCEPRRRELRLVGPLGASVHFHATAAGKVIAAHLPRAVRDRLLKELDLTALTPRTRTRRADVAGEWRDVARKGFAINQEETIVGAIFIASPIFDAEHAVCGSISVGIPKARYTPALGRKIAARVKDSCARLSASLAQLGYVHEGQ